MPYMWQDCVNVPRNNLYYFYPVLGFVLNDLLFFCWFMYADLLFNRNFLQTRVLWVYRKILVLWYIGFALQKVNNISQEQLHLNFAVLRCINANINYSVPFVPTSMFIFSSKLHNTNYSFNFFFLISCKEYLLTEPYNNRTRENEK